MGTYYDTHEQLINSYANEYDKITIKLDNQGNLVFTDSGSTFEIVDGLEKIRQDIWFLLKTIKGSSARFPDMGLDHEAIANSKYDPHIIIREIRRTIRMHPDVQYIRDFKISRLVDMPGMEQFQRKYFVKFNIYLFYDEIIEYMMLI